MAESAGRDLHNNSVGAARIRRIVNVQKEMEIDSVCTTGEVTPPKRISS